MLHLRPLTPADNAAMAHVIRTVMPEYDCVGEGYSINDPEVDDMAGTYHQPRSDFFVLEQAAGADAGAKIVGGAGYAPLAGGDPSVCELRKMYILQEGRRQGGGAQLMKACLAGAREAGFTHMYLETLGSMKDARAMYQKYGFTYLDGPMGATGHSGCDSFMVLVL